MFGRPPEPLRNQKRNSMEHGASRKILFLPGPRSKLPAQSFASVSDIRQDERDAGFDKNRKLSHPLML
jgi:hypothetical protein